MMINADFSKRVAILPDQMQWEASPAGGVERIKLDRIGVESGHATSIVRFAPGAAFPEHEHPGGEEFYVLEGVFSDDSGDYPAGSYIRNPIGTRHSPHSKDGCTIFVKLWQFEDEDQTQLAIDSRASRWMPGLVEGLSVLPLHQFSTEHVALVRWEPGTVFMPHYHPGGEEILVLEGTLSDEKGDYPKGSWIRNPPGSHHAPFSHEGCLILVKTGHLSRTA
ncbi:cupin domain-containing protein [Aestuariispira insulae]|uniref:ChrR-like anti-ECFsigma factor n=1 Tax=Aestuariispira insulae TaxID=1461337 RepID=A0A3D9HRC0_9PROT|nr:cupin domain-containing protein [Aestuariispira insulae]RED51999.1 ChrR-like anti-ECFsigma factor [Aestuariispira insulae]